MCDYCYPPSNPTQITETTSVAGAYPSIKPPPPGVPVNAIAATQILLDLIAELRAEHAREEVVICDGCPDTYDAGESCPRLRAADRAEARLREVQGE